MFTFLNCFPPVQVIIYNVSPPLQDSSDAGGGGRPRGRRVAAAGARGRREPGERPRPHGAAPRGEHEPPPLPVT